ncbi:RING-H2 finger protein [Nymphaea thermarum]|nr:RING-H2 finger protein [Nymphaea thermarum]
MEASASMVVEDEEVRCPICLEEFGTDREARETPCRHRYHKHCIDKELENHSTCPVCRFQMSPVKENNPAAGGAAQREGEGERRGRRAKEDHEQER